MHRDSSRAGLSLPELLVLVAITGVIAILLLPNLAINRHHGKAPRIKCINNLKNVGLAFRIFATDNNDQFPAGVMSSNGVEVTAIDLMSVYLTLSNELSTPKILFCPSDLKRRPPELNSFTEFTTKNISYFASLTASESTPLAFLGGDRNLQANRKPVTPGLFALTTNATLSWSKEIHIELGNILVADGSVQQMNSARLTQAAAVQGIATNFLAVP